MSPASYRTAPLRSKRSSDPSYIVRDRIDLGDTVPMFRAPNVGVRVWQLKHRTRRLLLMLFRQLPSMWSTARIGLPRTGFFSPHPHSVHRPPHSRRRYFFADLVSDPSAFEDGHSPLSQDAREASLLFLAEHSREQNDPLPPTSLPHCGQAPFSVSGTLLPPFLRAHGALQNLWL